MPSIKKNIILSTLYQLLVVILPFITAPYVSRVLGVENIGIYSYTSSYQTYFSMFAALGTYSYGVREISRARDDLEQRSRLFREIVLLTFFTSIICIAVWFCFIAVTSRYQIYYLVLTMGILTTMFDISWFFEGLEQFSYIVTKNALFKLLGVVMIFLLVKSRDDLLLYIIIMSASMLLGNLSMWIYIPKFTTKVPWRELRVFRHFKETIVYFIPTIATGIYTVLDKQLIGVLRDQVENGYYEQGTKIINIMKALTFTSLNQILGSRLSYLFAENKEEEVKEKIALSMDYILFMGLGICFGLIAVASRFVPMYFGPGYDKVIEILCLMSPLIVIIGVSNCLGSQYYIPAGKRATSAKFIVVGSVVNLILNLILIPKYGSSGAVIASIAAETAISILYLRYCDGFLTAGTLFTRGWKKLVAGAVMLAVLMFVDPLIRGDLAAVAAEVLIGGSVYLLILVILRDSFLCDFVLSRIRKKN